MASCAAAIPVSEVKRFMMDCLMKVGANRINAEQMADLLVAADYRGHFSHGLNRLQHYINDVKLKLCDPNAIPKVVKETAATAFVDGRNALGAVVGNFCMKIAMEKAKACGVGWVVAKGSTHFGMAGWYSMQAAKSGMLGMSFTNATPCLVPTRATEVALSSNPLSFAAPAKEDDAFILDMATSAVALGKIEVSYRKNVPIPEGWALDSEGQVTTNAADALQAMRLMPLGGLEKTSGYKGYGLSMMVDILCGILGGAAFGPNISIWQKHEKIPNLGQCFVAVNPDVFELGFQERLSSLMDHMRNMKPADPSNPVLVPGDPEKIHMKKVDDEGGIVYAESQIQSSLALAKEMDVTPMKAI